MYKDLIKRFQSQQWLHFITPARLSIHHRVKWYISELLESRAFVFQIIQMRNPLLLPFHHDRLIVPLLDTDLTTINKA